MYLLYLWIFFFFEGKRGEDGEGKKEQTASAREEESKGRERLRKTEKKSGKRLLRNSSTDRVKLSRKGLSSCQVAG